MNHEFITGDAEKQYYPDYTQLVVVLPFWHDDILLIQRESEPFTGRYSVPGGHVESETYQEAARRELHEETGMVADELAALPIFIDHDHRLECHGFRYDSPDGVFANPEGEEQRVIGWRTLEHAQTLPLTPGLKELFATLA